MKPRIDLQEKARLLRQKGYSYKEISQKIGASKSSISAWCANVLVSDRAKHRLRRIALEGGKRGRQRWADMRRMQRKEFLERIALETKKDIGSLSKRDRFIAGLMLYAGEGDRTQERVGMSNVNPLILRFMLDWSGEFLNIDRSAFFAHLYLHVGLSEPKAKAFWSKALRIKKERINYVYRPIPRISHKKNVHEFGVCSVRTFDVSSHRRVMGWIKAVLDN